MPRPKSLKPAFCCHKSSGRAFVKLDGKRIYLGRHGSQESKDAYDRAIGEWISRGRLAPPTPEIAGDVSVSMGVKVLEIAAGFWDHAQTYYRDKDGKPTAQVDHFRLAIKILNRLYGETPAAKFGPLALKVVRSEMLKPYSSIHPTTKNIQNHPGWSRHYANEQIGRLKRIFRWAVEQELVDVGVYSTLNAVQNIQAGKSDARETEPVRVVPQAHIDAVLPLVSSQVRTMIELQLLTGARPGEIIAMRGCDIDTANPKLWLYKPGSHKNQHRGHERTIYLGAKCQELIKRFLKPDVQAHLFSPAEAVAEWREVRNKNRKTPDRYGNVRGSNRQRNPKRPPGTRYDVNSYRHAIVRACEKAGVPNWHAHQLRHNSATFLRKEFGLDAARVILGHRSAGVTTLYAEVDTQKAADIMLKIG